ncbi:MAG: CDP-diacylglycerol---glycerol-3-phosphate 3-phosphatidyltransferase [Patescibacteria group bacterium]|jgi:phosphatidylglycerophosphate synthase|nr:CDP-diacylglycerol---glycerol-3-phosphate 3-phosphatidyltransferase [Patescibacteria group bacterium]
MHSISYDYHSGEDPPVVREVKWLLDQAAFWLLGWWLLVIKHYWPSSARAIDNVPNAMSVARIIVSPYVAYMLGAAIWRENTSDAWLWLGIAAGLIIMDGLDGPLARRLNAVSDFGKAIDPAADKTLILVLAIAYLVLTWHLQGLLAFLPLLGALSWVIWIELKLVLIARDTKMAVDALGDVELPGANVFGKVKFTIQSLSFILAYILLIAAPNSSVGALWLTFMLIIARFFADKSLHLHRIDLWKLQATARKRGVEVPQTRSVRELTRWARRNNQAA